MRIWEGMNEQIINAIENRKTMEFEYEGMIRIVEPHCYGLTKKCNEALRAYQIDGFSSSGKMGWKLFSLSKVSSIKILENNFNVREKDGYKNGDKGMSSIYKEV